MKPKNTKSQIEKRNLMKSPTRMENLTKQLLKMKQDIMDSSKKEIKKRVSGDVIQASGDEGDLSLAASDNDIRVSQLSTKHASLGRINDALTKIEDGTYGACDNCGEDIPLGRLKVMPFATHCVGCLEKVEQQERIEFAAVRED